MVPLLAYMHARNVLRSCNTLRIAQMQVKHFFQHTPLKVTILIVNMQMDQLVKQTHLKDLDCWDLD